MLYKHSLAGDKVFLNETWFHRGEIQDDKLSRGSTHGKIACLTGKVKVNHRVYFFILGLGEAMLSITFNLMYELELLLSVKESN